MSYQHFYSRVPARVSLFNKRDGFDTFAHSAALDREFILGELSCAYNNLLSAHDASRIRRDEIPTVYTQAALPSGKLVHTSVKYLPNDFTGERSAYLAHSLVLTDEEREAVMRNPAADVFNRDMFITDISLFKLTDKGVMANPACPERAYAPRRMSNHRDILSAYNPEMVKSLISSLLSAVCEEGRAVYFRLPYADSHISDAAVDFINGLMSVLPYSLRERLSFVSCVSHSASYPGFMLKCVDSSFSGVDAECGVFYDFTSGTTMGVSPDGERGVMLSSFLYSLLEHKNIRDEFHSFVQRIEEKYESVTMDIKTLKEIVFLFWQCSGFYVEESVLPGEDAICRLFDVYQNYRDGITVEHRVQVYRCLGRYSESQIAIPDSVFSRMSGLYPSECVEAKAVALDVLLTLIHVDLMRDSLFCFISRNYLLETDSVKQVIMSNFARVFYGGFLQNNILSFFDLYFRREPVTTRDIILDKLLLSIRTPEIQQQIVIFLDRHFVALNSAQKLKVCNTCLEMLPECDGLTALLINFINRRISRDSSDIPSLMNKKLTEMLASHLMAGDGRLAGMLLEAPGFCENIVMNYALNQWAGVEIILGILASMPLVNRADKLIRAFSLVEGGNIALYQALIYRFATIMVTVWPSTLKEILEMDKLAENKISTDVIEIFRQIVIYPAVVFTLHHAFSTDANAVGVDDAVAYAEKNPYIATTQEYRVILDYLSLVHKCGLGDTEGAFKIAIGFPGAPELRVSIAEYIRVNAYSPDTQDSETMATYEMVMDYLASGMLDCAALYARHKSRVEDIIAEDKYLGQIMPKHRASYEAMALMISCASEICDTSDELAALVMMDESGLKRVIKEYIDYFGPSAGILLKKHTKDAYFEIEELVSDLIQERNDSINSLEDVLNFLLNRKNDSTED